MCRLVHSFKKEVTMSVGACTEKTILNPTEQQESENSPSALHEKIHRPPPAASERGYSLVKQLKYEASLSWTLWKANPWWSKIEPYNIYLGGLPLAGHLQQIKDLGVTGIICLAEDFELQGWRQPVKKADWEAHGMKVVHISTVDFYPLTMQEFEEGVAALESMLSAGLVVYVHCKAGVGRSVSLVIAYLMKHRGISFDEAHALVQKFRPQINLNLDQRQAILDYISQKKTAPLVDSSSIVQETLSKLLASMLDYVIEGVSYESQASAFQAVTGWAPSATVESTLSRKDRYLEEFQGNQEAAVQAAIDRSHSMFKKLTSQALGFIPFVGTPTSYTFTLWHQLREVALIAALYGHDLNDSEVRMKILGALIEGNVMKLPAQTVDMVAKSIAKAVLLKAGIGIVPGFPAHLIFNYFTENAAKVSTYAKEAFGGDHAILPAGPQSRT